MTWCEANGVDYLFGLARNARLCRIIGAELHQARLQFEATAQAARARSDATAAQSTPESGATAVTLQSGTTAIRIFRDFEYRTKKSWSRPRRVIAKAEHLEKGSNPRFVVTSLPPASDDAVRGRAARTLYEDEYCARGEMENRIKEQQLYLFADRLSAASMRANQLRLYEAGAAYLLIHALRRLALRDTLLQQAQTPTLRQKLFKIGTLIRVSTRRVWCSWSQAYPYQELFRKIGENLRALSPLPWALPPPAPSGA